MSKDIILLTKGGIGDALVCTPVMRAIKETYPDRKLIVYCRKMDHKIALRHNPYIDSIRFLGIREMWKYPKHLYAWLFNEEAVEYTDLFFQHIPPSHIYSQDYSIKEQVYELFSNLPIAKKYNKIELYFTKKEEENARRRLAPYKNVVILHITSRSSQNHQWYVERWKQLVSELPQYTFIQLGWPDEEYVTGAIDWRGKTGLREAFCLMKYADSFAGVDSSLSHVSNAFDVPGVVVWGDSSPGTWGHSNNINIYKDLRCAPCYYYLWGGPCPYNRECMNQITVAEVRDALICQMEGRKQKVAVPETLELAAV